MCERECVCKIQEALFNVGLHDNLIVFVCV